MLNNLIKEGSLKIWDYSVDSLRKKHPLMNLFWECTLRCNLKCLHCGSKAGESDGRDEISTEEIKKAFKEIAQDFNTKDIFLSITGGEPLLRKDLFEVMKFAHGLGFEWGIVSNGQLLDYDIISKMKNSGISSVVISIDGPKDVHEYLRNKQGSHEKAIKAVKLIVEANIVKELNITTTIHKKNISYLEGMYSEFVELGIDSWRVANIDPIGRAEINKELLLSGSELKSLLEFIKVKRRSSPIEITYDCGGFLGNEFEGNVRRRFFMCGAGITVGSILANGDIFVCPNVPRKKELIQGNIRQDRFSEVWNKKFTFFRDKKRTHCEDCEQCEHWNHCLGNSIHLWNFEKQKPKICHVRLMGEKNKDF